MVAQSVHKLLDNGSPRRLLCHGGYCPCTAWHKAIANHCQRPIPACREVRMSLRKKPTMTEEGFAASHTNGMGFHGPATSEGRERTYAAPARCGPGPNQSARHADEKIMEGSSLQEVHCCPNLNVTPPFRAARAGLKPGATPKRRTVPKVQRLTNLTLKIKRDERPMEALKKNRSFPRCTRKKRG